MALQMYHILSYIIYIKYFLDNNSLRAFLVLHILTYIMYINVYLDTTSLRALPMHRILRYIAYIKYVFRYNFSLGSPSALPLTIS